MIFNIIFLNIVGNIITIIGNYRKITKIENIYIEENENANFDKNEEKQQKLKQMSKVKNTSLYNENNSIIFQN